MTFGPVARCKPSWMAGPLGLFLVFGQSAYSMDMGAELRAGYGTSDNIERVAEDEVDETIVSAGFSLDMVEDRNRFDFLLRSSIDYITYQNGTYEDEPVGGLNLEATYWFVPERINWFLKNNWGQRVLDPFSATDPGNREDINYFTTGPSFKIQASSRNALGLDLRASIVRYDIQPYDNNQQAARVYFERAVRSDARISLNLRTREVDFDAKAEAIDYTVNDAFVRFEKENERDVFFVDAGVSEADIDDGDKRDGYLLQLAWDRTVSPFTTFSLYGGTSFTDGLDLFRDRQDSIDDIGDTINVNAIDQPRQNNFAGFRFDRGSDRTNLALRLDWSQDDYEEDVDGTRFDRDVTDATLRFSRDLTRDLFMSARADYSRYDYKFIDRLDKDTQIRLGLGYNFTPSFNVTVESQFYERDAIERADSFSETRAFVYFIYRSSWGGVSRQ